MSEIDPIIVREELDTILANEITSFIDIEARIAALATDLAMPCPLCSGGKVTENKIEKGKEYYSCDSEDCRFVS